MLKPDAKVYVNGCLRPSMDYSEGPADWSTGHCVVYAGGTERLIPISKGKSEMDNQNRSYFSVLLAWNESNLDDGTYSWAGFAANSAEAEDVARAQMFLAECDDHGYDPDAMEIPEYLVIDVYEGANVWAAREMYDALRKAHTALTAIAGVVKINSTDALLEITQALEAGRSEG